MEHMFPLTYLVSGSFAIVLSKDCQRTKQANLIGWIDYRSTSQRTSPVSLESNLLSFILFIYLR